MKAKVTANIDQLEELGMSFQEACEMQGHSFQFRSNSYMARIAHGPSVACLGKVLFIHAPDKSFHLMAVPPNFLEIRGMKQLELCK